MISPECSAIGMKRDGGNSFAGWPETQSNPARAGQPEARHGSGAKCVYNGVQLFGPRKLFELSKSIRAKIKIPDSNPKLG
jgi:hypothetical protein